MKSTLDKEEYRRAYTVKQKMEGIPYRTIAKDMGVNYRSVYDWIDNYRKHDFDGIKKRKKWGQKTSNIYYKEQRDDKRYGAEQIAKEIWFSKKHME